MDLKHIRKAELGLSQAQLGELLGLQQSTVSRFERGVLPIDGRTALALEALIRRKQDTDQASAA